MLVGRCYILNKNHNWTFLLHEFFFFPFFFARIFFLGIFPCMNFFLAFSPPPPPPHHFSNGPSLSSRYLYYFAIIPIRSTCTMWPNYSVSEQLETAFKLRQRMENLPSCTHVLHKILNLVISSCCLAEHGEEMYQNL